MPASYEQLQARFRIDTAAANTAATWGAALNAAWTRAPGADFRIRFTIQTTGSSGAAAASTENLYTSKNAGAYVAIGGTSGILASATASASADETSISSAQLPVGTGVFVNGVYDSSGATNSFTIPRGDYTEVEYGIKIDPANSVPGDTFDFRVYRGASVQSLYSNTPRITATGVNLAGGSYALNPGGVAGTMTFARPHKNMAAGFGAYAFNIANLVTTSVTGSTAIPLAYAPFSYSGGPNTTLNYYPIGGASHPFPIPGGTYAWNIANTVTTSSTAGRVLYPDVGHYAWSIANQVTTSVTGVTHSLPLDIGHYTLTGKPVTLTKPIANSLYGVSIATLGVDHIVSLTTGAYGVTGRPITFGRIAILASGSYSLTGFQITARRTHLAVLNGGAYSLSGTQMTLAKFGHPQMGAGIGTYAVSGPLPVLKSSRTMLLGYATYALIGSSIGPTSTRSLNLAFGPYSLTGLSSILDRTHRYMTLAGGSYSVAGQLMGFKSGPHTIYPTPPGFYGVVGTITIVKSNRNMQLGFGSYSVTGEPVSLPRGHTVGLTVGFYNSQGYQITVRRTYAPPIATGMYSLSGPPVSFQKIGAHTLGLDGGPYSLVGGSANFVRTRSLVSNFGAYTVTGRAITANTAHTLSLGVGVYSLTGQPVTVKRGRTSVMAGGVYALTGEPVTLTRNIHPAMSLASGSYALTGPTTIFAKGHTVAMAGGTYSYTGQPITLKTGRAPVSLAGGTYALTGPAMTFKRVRVLVPNTGSYLTYGPSTIRLVGPGGKLGGQTSAWVEILRRRRRA